MQTKTIRSDFTVVGGGLAGVCAAIAAARENVTVTLVQDRPVLGGNSSSEVRLWALGALHSCEYTRYTRESGIMGELFLENLARNPEGNPVLWDPLLIEWVTREPNITLLLDTAAYELDVDDDGAITSVTALCSPSQTKYILRSPVYLDASGDGILGFLAGAEFRIGREARDEFGEMMAPEHPDRETLGSSIYFFTKRLEHPVQFVKPSFAIDIGATTIPKFRRITDTTEGSHYWWIEYGGVLDTIYDHQHIKFELWKVVYGIWDYIKNSGTFAREKVENLTLEWVGLTPGKRESRRFIGDHILREQDVLEQQEFTDVVAAGGWSLDLHPAQGIYSDEPPCWQICGEGVFGIPYRTLYSKTVPNLFLGGRLISASHVAFGSTRVMATCGVMGQATGTAAAICVKEDLAPRDLSVGEPLTTLQRQLQRADQWMPGFVAEDPDDIAPLASVSASSVGKLDAVRETNDGTIALDEVRGVQVPVVERLDALSFLADIARDTIVEWSVWRNAKRINYVPTERIGGGSTVVKAGERSWINLSVNASVEGENCWVLLSPNPAIRLHTSDERLSGVLSVRRRVGKRRSIDAWVHESEEHTMWPYDNRSLVFRVTPAQPVWEAANVIDGWSRQHILPHLWASEPINDGKPEWIELAWDSPHTIRSIHLVMNTDMNRLIYNVQHSYSFRAIPECIRNATIQAMIDGKWRNVGVVRDNHHRLVVVDVDPVTTDRIRVRCEATHGHNRYELNAIRVYA